MRICLLAVFQQLLLTAVANANEPRRAEATRKVEQAAYDKAKCVYDAITVTGQVFFRLGEALSQRGLRGKNINDLPAEPSTPEQAATLLESFNSKSREGVRACLTERNVYDLGRYSLLEDLAMHPKTACLVSKAPAARFCRGPNNYDGDIVNGSTHWMQITDATSISVHPFFQGQSEARSQFSKSSACKAIIQEFRPNGSRFPGMVRPGY